MSKNWTLAVSAKLNICKITKRCEKQFSPKPDCLSVRLRTCSFVRISRQTNIFLLRKLQSETQFLLRLQLKRAIFPDEALLK
jgi:hypothetical protein